LRPNPSLHAARAALWHGDAPSPVSAQVSFAVRLQEVDMTQEQRELILATDYRDILANKSVREMLERTIDVIPENIEQIFDQAIEAYFGLKVADLDTQSLEHARTVVRRARHRLVK
jgi:hypothetical protein